MEEPRKPAKLSLLSRRVEQPPILSRLAHEHDMNDAIWERLHWQEHYQKLMKDIEERAKHGVEKKIAEHNSKGVGHMFNHFVWSNIYAGLLILVLKILHIL